LINGLRIRVYMYLLRYLFSYCHACFERWLILGLQGIYTLHLCTSVIESRMLSCNFFRKDTNNEDLQNLQNLNRGFVVHYCLLFSFSWVYMELTVSFTISMSDMRHDWFLGCREFILIIFNSIIAGRIRYTCSFIEDANTKISQVYRSESFLSPYLSVFLG